MDPMVERLLVFVAGLVAGWFLHALVTRGHGRTTAPRHDETLARAFTPPQPSTPAAPETPPPAPLSPAEVAAHVRVIDVAAARTAGFNLRHMADLTVIDGIGPRTSDLLRANGIDDFAALARAGADELRAMLDQGGPSFRLANPDDWPAQAQLAVENRWSELKALQRVRIGSLPPAEPES